MKRMTGALGGYNRVFRGMMLAESLRKLLCYARLIEIMKKQRQGAKVMIELKPFDETDYQTFIDWQQGATEKDLFSFMGRTFTLPITLDQLTRYVDEARQKALPVELYTIIETKTGEKIGHIQVADIDYLNQSAFLNRIFIRKKSRGKGYGLKLMNEMKRYVFQELGFHRLSLYVLSNNRGAYRLYEKAGFTEEGIMRESRYFDGEYLDLHLMSMLKGEASFTASDDVE
jgi:RimJ/RimL family protein N-acetyltransferase